MALDALLQALLLPAPAVSHANVKDFWAFHAKETAGVHEPVDRAVLSAVRADRLGFAFAAGYVEALRSLVPTLPIDWPVSFAVTEGGPPRPRSILTRLDARGDGFVLEGKKSWVTLGPAGGILLVVARLSEADAEGRPRLRVVQVDARAPGVTLRPTAPPPFTPEIDHAEVQLEGVAITSDAVLPGDGWYHYAKPFRTIEDLHVHAATLAFLAGVAARAEWPRAQRERLVAAVVTARSLALAPPASAPIHVAAAGLFATVTSLLADCESAWESVDAEVRDCFFRDRPILALAGRARAERLEKAWTTLASSDHTIGQSR